MGQLIQNEPHVDFFQRNLFQSQSLPIPPALQFRASRNELEPLILPLARLYKGRPSQPNHGKGHATSTAMAAAVIDAMTPFPSDPVARRLVILAGFLHDIARYSDFEIGQFRHARRGAAFVRDCGYVVLRDISPEHREIMAYAIGRHSLTSAQRQTRHRLRDCFASMTEAELAASLETMSLRTRVELILQEADKLDLQRVLYTSLTFRTLPRLARRVDSALPGAKNRANSIERQLVFPATAQLLPLTDALYWHCTTVQTEDYGHDPLGTLLSCGQDIGYLKP